MSLEIRAIIIDKRTNYNCGLFKLYRFGEKKIVWTKEYPNTPDELLIKKTGAIILYKDTTEWNDKFYLEFEPEDLELS